MNEILDSHSIILFDGVCNLCHVGVIFVIKRDKKGFFKFAALQSKTGQQILQLTEMDYELDSFILIENNKFYFKSTAALRVVKKLDKAWFLLYGLIIVPSLIRDYIYDYIAKNRYRWFGKKNQCMIPNSNILERFLS